VDASDLIQETMLEAYRDFHRFRGVTEAEWLAWLRQIGRGGMGVVFKARKHFMFMVGLVAMAFIVSYQVNRVRALSRYYEHRPLPK
jgi:Sigma-70 region 2